MKQKLKPIRLIGVRQNNLKNISVDVPARTFTVVCGPSGSGKSSLAFETLFAEGQRRYLESLSNYARQFVGRAGKPLVDRVENIYPAIALEQKNSIRSSRSTVGTHSEIYDYLRVLFARLGTPYCPNHHTPMKSYSASAASEEILRDLNGKRLYIISELHWSKKDEGRSLREKLLKLGYRKALKLNNDGGIEKILELDQKELSSKSENHFLILDRVQVSEKSKARVFDALSQGMQLTHKLYGKEVVQILSTEGGAKKFKKSISCSECDEVFWDLTPELFSFNNPLGACTHCSGFGNILEIDKNIVIPNENLSIEKNAIHPFSMPSGKADQRELKKFCKQEGIDITTSWKKLSKTDQDKIWNGHGDWYGVLGVFEYLESKKYKMHIRVFLSRFKSTQPCNVCKGKRLNKKMEQVKIADKSISEATDFSLEALLSWVQNLKLKKEEATLTKEIREQMQSRLTFLNQVGLSYLTLARPTKTLSGGEFQRLNISNQIGTELTDTLYVLDEPTIGLHPRDNAKLIEQLKKLHKNNNTVVVVEHDSEVIKNADHVIEMGPESGLRGGEVIFSGSQKDFKKSKSKTSKYLYGNSTTFEPLKAMKRTPAFELKGCKGHNLKSINFKAPLNQITSITGVSGSGKSSLVSETLYPALVKEIEGKHINDGALEHESLKIHKSIKSVEFISQKRITKSRRSNIATYLGVFDHIRKIFADKKQSKLLGYTPGSFSLNTSGGRCPACKGLGIEEIEMLFMDNIDLPCEACNGIRYTKDILKIKHKEKSIHEVLQMTAEEAADFFHENTKIKNALKILKALKLDYLSLGQTLDSLSGGESQRLKLSKHLSETDLKGKIIIFDEPSTGLHFNEIKALIDVLNTLQEAGATVIVVEHNLDIIASSSWIIDIGPEAGEGGGSIVAEGHPKEIIKHSGHTSTYLMEHIKNRMEEF